MSQLQAPPPPFQGVDQQPEKVIAIKTPEGLTIQGDEHYLVQDEWGKTWTLYPTSFVPGTFNSNPITFRITPGQVSLIDESALVLTCTESGGSSSITPPPSPWLINRIEFGVNSQPSPVQTLYGESIYMMMQLFPNEKVNSYLGGNSMNMTAGAYANPSAIAASGTMVYNIPLWGAVLSQLDPKLLSGDIVVTVYPQPSPAVAGSGTLQLNNIALSFKTYHNPTREASRLALYNTGLGMFDYINIVPTTYQGTLTAGTQTDIPLQGFDGNVAALGFNIRSSLSYTAGAVYSFSALGGSSEVNGQIDVLDANRATIQGSGYVSPQYNRYLQNVSLFEGQMAAVLPIYWVVHDSKPKDAFLEGINSGFYHYRGKEFLRIQPGTGFTTATYTVTIWYFSHSRLARQLNGQLKRLA